MSQKLATSLELFCLLFSLEDEFVKSISSLLAIDLDFGMNVKKNQLIRRLIQTFLQRLLHLDHH